MTNLDTLAQYRDAILLAELGAWLHMLGKYNWQFIESHCSGTTSYDYQNFVSALSTLYPQLFKFLDINSAEYQAVLSALPITSPSSVGVFIRDHRKTKEARQDKLSDQLTMLLVDAHGRGSNIEKSEIASDFPSQTLPNVYLSTAFGFSKQLTATAYQTTVLNHLNDFIQHLLLSSDVDKWADFVKQIRQKLFSNFQTALAETRLPFNDVTLFDQTASTVAFFKPALAERVVARNWKRLIDGSNNQYKWRTLSIPIAGLEYLQNVSGIADLLGKQSILTQAQNAVQTLLEVTYPVGQEIYRDEQTSVFLVPDEVDLLQWQNSDRQTLKALVQQEISQVTTGDIFPELQNVLMVQGTRTVYIVGQQISKASAISVTSDIVSLTKTWEGVTNRQICANCGLRPQVPSNKASGRKLCDTCLKRHEQRAKEWATSKFDQTIWLDEVADNNGRLALLVGNWNLERWLDGTLVGTIIAASNIDFTQLETDCRGSLMETQRFQGLLINLLNNNVRKQFEHQFRGYFETIIQPEWQHLSATGLPEETIAAMHFVRQNPSFARLRRVWETTRRFWREVLFTEEGQAVDQSVVAEVVGKKKYRYAIKGSLNVLNGLGSYHAYELNLGGVSLAVVWDKDNSRFITCDNLDYLEKLLGKPVIDVLTGKMAIEEPSNYGKGNRDLGHITVDSVDGVKAIPDSEYVPAIPILAEPRTFMALVPADKTLSIVQAIKAKYEREMGKVRNRLPLHVGVVYAQRRTPLRAVLDAGRRMLKYPVESGQTSVWTVKDVSNNLPDSKKCLANGTQQFQQTIAVELEQNGRKLTWCVPAVMGDGTTPDHWYPYVFAKSDVSERKLIFKGLRPKSDGSTEGCWLVHASELRAGDEVYFMPATFDFEWLDTAGRRFEIAYDNGQRRNCPTRPYLLDDLDTITKIWQEISGPNGLSNSQIYHLHDLVESKRTNWEINDTFNQFCKQVAQNAEWINRKEIDLELITQSIINGTFADVVELYMNIMKQ